MSGELCKLIYSSLLPLLVSRAILFCWLIMGRKIAMLQKKPNRISVWLQSDLSEWSLCITYMLLLLCSTVYAYRRLLDPPTHHNLNISSLSSCFTNSKQSYNWTYHFWPQPPPHFFLNAPMHTFLISIPSTNCSQKQVNSPSYPILQKCPSFIPGRVNPACSAPLGPSFPPSPEDRINVKGSQNGWRGRRRGHWEHSQNSCCTSTADSHRENCTERKGQRLYSVNC